MTYSMFISYSFNLFFYILWAVYFGASLCHFHYMGKPTHSVALATLNMADEDASSDGSLHADGGASQHMALQVARYRVHLFPGN